MTIETVHTPPGASAKGKAKKPAPKKGGRKKKGQAQIPGTERKTIPELQELAVERAAEVAAWQAHQKAAEKLDERLEELMRENISSLPKNDKGQPFYRFEDDEGQTRDVVLKHTERYGISVIKAKFDESP